MTINVILAFMIIVSFLISIVLHEVGHSLMATWLGDPTARAEGRLSLSLRPHLDPLGTMLCVILAFFPVLLGIGGLAAAPLGMGWGKPVKPDPWKLRGGPNAGTLLVALGGIFMNIVIAVLAAIVLRLLPASLYPNAVAVRIPQFVLTFASVNFCLAIFNLLPLYPLDGYQNSLYPAAEPPGCKFFSLGYLRTIYHSDTHFPAAIPGAILRAGQLSPVSHLVLYPAWCVETGFISQWYRFWTVAARIRSLRLYEYTGLSSMAGAPATRLCATFNISRAS